MTEGTKAQHREEGRSNVIIVGLKIKLEDGYGIVGAILLFYQQPTTIPSLFSNASDHSSRGLVGVDVRHRIDFMLNGTPASWRSGQPVAWGDEARKIELDDNAYDCSVSADEKFLALAIGRQVRIYDLENLELRKALNGHTEKVFRVEFFPLDIAGNKYKLVSESKLNDAMIVVWTLDKHGKNTNEPPDSVDIEGLAATATEQVVRTLITSHGWMKEHADGDKLLAAVKEVVSRADASHIIQDNLVFSGELTRSIATGSHSTAT
ncbi:hypothetical protein V1527DRAFT_502401 [Lipomyces starkeyi]